MVIAIIDVSCNPSRCLASYNCVLDNIAEDNVEIAKPRERYLKIDKKFIIENIFILLKIICDKDLIIKKNLRY